MHVQHNLENFHIEGFQTDLLSWFEREHRKLPWRESRDPYKIWVSEIMLQQTRVDTVIPYYLSFIEQFPTIESLAMADEENVLKAWEGLGYYSRVRNLQSAVKEVHAEYGGVVPNRVEEISKLKGVGPYTTGAILSIAYGVPEPAVDGNVMRVLSRILSIWDDIAKPKTRKLFENIIKEIISKENPSYFNQGLMELGAMVCTPTSPSCLLCPVREHCQAFSEGTQSQLPVKTKKNVSKIVPMVVGILRTEDDRFVIHKRPETGLLAKLWEFPNVEMSNIIPPKQQLSDFLQKNYSINARIEELVGTLQHVFSHLTWNISAYEGIIEGEIEESASLQLVTMEEMKAYAFPVSHQKIWVEYLKNK